MNRSMTEYLPAVLNLVAAGIVMLVSFLADLRFPMPKETAKLLGVLVVITGMALVAWAATHIKGAFLGEVEPRLEGLVSSGPYQFVRHPVYLGMTIALAGVPISLRSWPGLIGVFLLFLPSEIYRASLEDQALLRKFGETWRGYARRTGFILPLIGRK